MSDATRTELEGRALKALEEALCNALKANDAEVARALSRLGLIHHPGKSKSRETGIPTPSS